MRHARTNVIRLGAVALASAASLGAAGAAGAAGTAPAAGNSGAAAVPKTLAGIKAQASTDITARVNALNAAMAKAKADSHLGTGQAALVTYLGTDVTPLQQLNQKIQGDTSVEAASQDFSSIFSSYRVFRLVLPASEIAVAADHATATAIPALTTAATMAQARVNPSNQGELQPLLNDLTGQISTATNATNGIAATVLAFAPAQWNANNGLLSPAKSSVQSAHGALVKGRTDVQQIRMDLKGSSGAGAQGTPATTS